MENKPNGKGTLGQKYMPSLTPLSVQRAIRLAGIVSAIGCAIFFVSFGALAVAVSFQPHWSGVQPWLAILGVVLALALMFAGVYFAKKLLFAPLSEIAERVPIAACVVAYSAGCGVLFTPAIRDLARGKVYLDFGRTVAPFLIAWITYRFLKSYIEPYFSKKKT